jgi:hypothetical protein
MTEITDSLVLFTKSHINSDTYVSSGFEVRNRCDNCFNSDASQKYVVFTNDFFPYSLCLCDNEICKKPVAERFRTLSIITDTSVQISLPVWIYRSDGTIDMDDKNWHLVAWKFCMQKDTIILIIRCNLIEKHLTFNDLIEYNINNPNLKQILTEIDTQIRLDLEIINKKM